MHTGAAAQVPCQKLERASVFPGRHELAPTKSVCFALRRSGTFAAELAEPNGLFTFPAVFGLDPGVVVRLLAELGWATHHSLGSSLWRIRISEAATCKG
jgi:hypothetical protein